jgi:outer membrane protein assembly factor BamB
MPVQNRFRRGLMAAACITAVLFCTAPVRAGADSASTTQSRWPQPHADAAHSNRAVGNTTLTASRLAARGVQPQYSLSGLPFFGDCGGIFPGFYPIRPLIAGGRMYIYNGREIEARNLATGALIWRSASLVGRYVSNLVTAVTLAGDHVIVGGVLGCESNSGSAGFLLSLDIGNGHRQWEHRSDSGFDSPVILTVSGSTVVANGGNFGVFASLFGAYDVTTGRRLWNRGNQCEAGYSFIVAGRVISNTFCGTLNLATGKTEWTKTGDWTFIRGDGPGVSHPSIYASNPHGELVALAPNGGLRWNAGTGYGTVLAAGGGRVFVSCHHGDSVCALDRLTGVRQWRTVVFNLADHDVVSAGDFVVAPSDGDILRASNGVPVTNLAGSVDPWNPGEWDSAVVADGRIVAVQGRSVDVFRLNH